MQERGVQVDHSTIGRWAIRFLPLPERVFRNYKRPVGGSWAMDETYIKANGMWKFLHRAVDKAGRTVDFLFTAKRDKKAAMRFFEKATAPSNASADPCPVSNLFESPPVSWPGSNSRT